MWKQLLEYLDGQDTGIDTRECISGAAECYRYFTGLALSLRNH